LNHWWWGKLEKRRSKGYTHCCSYSAEFLTAVAIISNSEKISAGQHSQSNERHVSVVNLAVSANTLSSPSAVAGVMGLVADVEFREECAPARRRGSETLV
jgi:hypothetical protein